MLQFAVYSAVALALAAASILWFVRQDLTKRAEQNSAAHTRFVAATILRDRLERTDFDGSVSIARRAQLDRLFDHEILVDGALRTKLYSLDGHVTYSTDHSLIGSLTDDEDETQEVVEGRTLADVSTLNAEGGTGPDVKVLETYTPLRMGGGPPVGVFELYQDYAPVARASRQAFFHIAPALAVALLLLYAALFPILRRVTRRMRRQFEEIERQALYDALTELPNRALFRDRVRQALHAARRDGTRAAVLLVDLDQFKDVNDTLGHQSGDRLLAELGNRLRARMRASDTVARLGGDEFAILAPTVADAAAARVVAETARDELAQPLALDGLQLEPGSSIGIALFPDHGDDVDDLIRHADVAMYLAKERRTGVELYAAENDHYSPERLMLVAELRAAIERRELELVYQPKVSLGDGTLRSVEALVRWRHPTRGLLMPDAFIPLAEHTGLIRPLTRFVITAALRQCREWQQAGLDVSVAVNVSARDLLDGDLPEEVAALLACFGIDGGKLELELTESTFLADPIRARALLGRLSELGVALAVDDFGSGYSSLGYLKQLPIDVLKIDKSFVMAMDGDADDAAIVRSTIGLARNLGLAVVAEGVESDRVWHELAALGCTLAQGYFVGRPMPAGELDAWQASWTREATLARLAKAS
jgi:diguanylate cyclase (GGDEF)-like protein